MADSELTQTCGSPECAETFFDDLASALNTLNDPVLGCNSGIKVGNRKKVVSHVAGRLLN